MRNFIFKLQQFMQGRYGNDELNLTMLAVAFILAIISRFTFGYVTLIFTILEFALIGLTIFRMLSRNVYKRANENRKFKPIFQAVTGWFSLTYKRFRDGKTHRYYKCPNCKAQLRVKNIKGKHTIKCPKCQNQFTKTIR